MMTKIRLLYLGNNLSEKSKYKTTISTLSGLLGENYSIEVYSNKINKISRLLEMCLQLLKSRSNIDYVLIDTFSTSAFYFALFTSQIARILNKKYIPILHGGNLPKRLDDSPILCNMVFKYSYKNVAPSRYLEYEFNKRGFKTINIPNVLELSNYNFKQRKDIKPNLLYVRSFDKIYNPTLAIYVLKELKNKYPLAKLCMIGPDKDGSLKEVQNLVNEFDLKESVEFTGVLEQKEWHKKSEEYDVFINTTNFDNTPVSVMEAMALGLPVVSTNAGGVPYLISDKKDGFLVSKNDKDEMIKAIESLLEDNQLVEKFTDNALKKVQSFDWKNVEKKWDSILRNAL